MAESSGNPEPALLIQPASEIHETLAPERVSPVVETFGISATALDGHFPNDGLADPVLAVDRQVPQPPVDDDVEDSDASGDVDEEADDEPDEHEVIPLEDVGEIEMEEYEDDYESDNESLYEVALEGLSDETLRAGTVEDACTLDEALEYRKQLRLIGKNRFVDEVLFSGKVTAKKLCTAFGIMTEAIFPDGAQDEDYYPILNLGMEREIRKRQKLRQYNSVDDAVALIEKSRNIIVVTGAGISTSLGIPDFRSAGTGFYDRLAANGLTDRISEPSEVFDMDVFRTDPDIFFSVARDILPPEESTGRPQFTPTHAFIKLLEEKGRLLRNYTQNIDNIESLVGISKEKIVQCHGSFATATCQKCRFQVPGEDILPQIRAQEIAYCKKCEAELEADQTNSRKRRLSPKKSEPKKRRKGSPASSSSSEESDDAIPQAGIMKPDITFFGEALPDLFHDRIAFDRHNVDLVLVIGTSLKVDPVASIPAVLDPDVPQLYISKSRCNHIDFDIEFNGDCDVVVAELCRRLGWDLKHEMVTGVPARTETLEGEVFEHRHLVYEGKKVEEEQPLVPDQTKAVES